jgi:hypothetical protein
MNRGDNYDFREAQEANDCLADLGETSSQEEEPGYVTSSGELEEPVYPDTGKIVFPNDMENMRGGAVYVTGGHTIFHSHHEGVMSAFRIHNSITEEAAVTEVTRMLRRLFKRRGPDPYNMAEMKVSPEYKVLQEQMTTLKAKVKERKEEIPVAPPVPVFTPEELKEFQERLANGEVMETDCMGGCHTYIRSNNEWGGAGMQYLETLVTHDGIYFTMGIDKHYGLKKIENTTPSQIVDWYNEVLALQGKCARYTLAGYDKGPERTVIVQKTE